MTNVHRVSLFVTALMLATSMAAPAQPTSKPLTPSQMVSPSLLVTRIDTNCAVVRSAIKSQTPTDVLRARTSTWKVASAGDVHAAERTHVAVTHAQVWKQTGNLVWVHWITEDGKGNEHAAQLCFRNDGSLARARQATTVPALDGAAARQAYYNTDGSLIRKSAMFSVDDPAIYKRVRSLPFFKMVQ